MRKSLEQKKSELSGAVRKAEWQKKNRSQRREKLLVLKAEYPEAAKFLNVENNAVGCPRLETKQDGLMQAITDLVLHSGSADERRRSEAIRSCKTLHQIHAEIERLGYKLSKTSLYYRFLPPNRNSTDGKRHVVTVPVKLCRAKADLHRDHTDQHFCRASINSLEEVASILGPEQVRLNIFFLKIKFKIGLINININFF